MGVQQGAWLLLYLPLYSTPNDRERGNDAAVLLARPGEEDGDVMLNPSVFDATALI